MHRARRLIGTLSRPDRCLWVGAMLVLAAVTNAQGQSAIPPPPCSAGSSSEQAACWRRQAQRLPAIRQQLSTARECAGYDPARAGAGDSPCMDNTVDSTCRYASGAASPMCSKPIRCAYGTFNYLTGRCEDEAHPACPPGTSRAGQPPDPVVGCNSGCVGGACPDPAGGPPPPEGPFFILKPGQTVLGEFYLYVHPRSGGAAASTSVLETAGRPLEDMAQFARLLTALRAEKTGGDFGIEAISAAMADDIERMLAGGIVQFGFDTVAWADPAPSCSPAPTPDPPRLAATAPSWKAGAGFAPGTGACGGYGSIIARASLTNDAQPLSWSGTWQAQASMQQPGDCPASAEPASPWPASMGTTDGPKGTQPTLRRTAQRYLGDLSCTARTHPERQQLLDDNGNPILDPWGNPIYQWVPVHTSSDGIDLIGIWEATYQFHAPSAKVTRVEVTGNGQAVIAWP